jgi:energy-converting hydrogenase Eha subunit E
MTNQPEQLPEEELPDDEEDPWIERADARIMNLAIAAADTIFVREDEESYGPACSRIMSCATIMYALMTWFLSGFPFPFNFLMLIGAVHMILGCLLTVGIRLMFGRLPRPELTPEMKRGYFRSLTQMLFVATAGVVLCFLSLNGGLAIVSFGLGDSLTILVVAYLIRLQEPPRKRRRARVLKPAFNAN